MLRPWRAWSWALIVMVITVLLVVLDIADGAVHHYWSRHSFTSSVLSGVLVLLLTVLIVDRVTRRRQLRSQSRAIAAQASIIVAQAAQAVDAMASSSPSDDDRDAAADQLRTYAVMLLTSAPLLIGANRSRSFLEKAQRVAAQLFQVLRDGDDGRVSKPRLEESLAQLRAAAAPLLQALTPAERAAVGPEAVES
ncbi:MAG TPA: hypothetical protein VMA77_10935 [Solirubrobacteraceae bacterium]|nr:hypothetical protein [Solirubrobacteraceae bacterium]